MPDPNQKLAAHLKALLESLARVAKTHDELYDTDVREQMFEAVFKAFIHPEPGYVLPDEFGMFSAEANAQVKTALQNYVTQARQTEEKLHITAPEERLDTFQNPEVCTDADELYPDDFFGWMNPDDLANALD